MSRLVRMFAVMLAVSLVGILLGRAGRRLFVIVCAVMVIAIAGRHPLLLGQ